MERMASGEESYGRMHDRVQQALRSIGTVEKAVRDLGTDELLLATRQELSDAVTSLQEVRDWLSARGAA
jgi:hypothetical protein